MKVWDAATLSPKAALPPQADWPTALAFAEKALIVGRLDGGVTFYSPSDGKVIEPPPPPKPELSAVSPRGVQRGETTTLKLSGKNLNTLTTAAASSPKLHITIKPDARPESVTLEVATDPDAAPGPVDLWVSSPGGESGRIRLWIDDGPSAHRRHGRGSNAPFHSRPVPGATSKNRATSTHSPSTPRPARRSCWTWLLSASAPRRTSSWPRRMRRGRVLATVNDADGSLDPLMLFRPPADGRYVARLSELKAEGSAEHFYRLSVGRFAVVTGAFPLAVPPSAETKVKLLGYNLPAGAAATVKAEAGGEATVPIDPNLYRRARREGARLRDACGGRIRAERRAGAGDPAPGRAGIRSRHPLAPRRWLAGCGPLPLRRKEGPGADRRDAGGAARLAGRHADLRFSTPTASRSIASSSRAVRDSWVTFRAADANAAGRGCWKYEEMQLNQYLYFGGEVVRLFLEPRARLGVRLLPRRRRTAPCLLRHDLRRARAGRAVLHRRAARRRARRSRPTDCRRSSCLTPTTTTPTAASAPIRCIHFTAPADGSVPGPRNRFARRRV